ncbi:copper resistance protein B [Roseisolibacter agri]|uniref:Copper resistance protein B n=1 Tax=Roseisolibacter agri TaxID=2014610 RepID=A0AA37Q8D0_9BACT|nr:copper resistance protein B [Roseisolibacter agri]GLC28149.1 hypothetical protein rosag_46620 [Roseisolibacter agri]
MSGLAGTRTGGCALRGATRQVRRRRAWAAAAALLFAAMAARPAGAQGTPASPSTPAPPGTEPPTRITGDTTGGRSGRVTGQSHGQGTGPAHGMMMDRTRRVFLLTEVLEIASGESALPITLDGTGWIGGDYHRVFLNVDAEQPTRGGREIDLRGDVNYGRLVSPFWSALVGVRVESRRGEVGPLRTRGLLHFGMEGLAPGWFTLEPSLYVSPTGQVSARIAGTTDFLLTQRLIVQPRAELHAVVQRVPEFLYAPGLTDAELGVRLRYEFRRDFAPYVGLSWFRRTGGSAGLARAAGESDRTAGLVAGVRVWR